MNNNRNTQISKYLSLILRHQPESISLKLDTNGWANISELLQKSNLKFSFDELEEVVATNEKKRFSFDETKSKIRANQGHSISIDLALLPQNPPNILYHGTVAMFIQDIKQEGLKKMSRQHVHLSKDIETAKKVGNRRGKAIILSIKAEEMVKNGFQFFCSDNGVWLTDHVPAQFIEF